MYYLHHYFDPDFSHLRLKPEDDVEENVAKRYLGYVQNAVAGQVLAECINLDDYPGIKYDQRFIYKNHYLPVGPNCAIHPENPDKIIATANGYCFYHDGLITVKKLLNVRGNVSFHTGNIFFVGDMAVHGDVQTGFAVNARNILVRGHIESSKVKATRDIVCTSGVKGSNIIQAEKDPDAEFNPKIPDTLLDCQGTIRLPFCEHAQIRAKGNVIIDGHCLHSTIYVGGNLIVKGRLQGGEVYGNGIVYVGGQLGGDYSSPTRIYMGYDPFDFLTLQKLETKMRYLKDKLIYFEKLAARNEVMQLEYQPRLDLVERKLKIAHARKNILWHKFAVDEENAFKCKVIVPGKIMPGSEISIARVFHKMNETIHDTTFMLGNDELIFHSPAIDHATDQHGAWK